MSSNLKNCAFCGADRKHFRANPKTKAYEVRTPEGNSTMVETNLDVMQCLKCQRRWIRYAEIKGAVNNRV